MSNPYAPPESTAAPTVPDGLSYMERDRTEHRVHEARVRILGIVFLLQGGSRLVSTGAALAWLVFTPQAGEGWPQLGVWLGVFGVTAALSLVGGGAMHQLKPWGRWVGLALSAVSLASFPVGTLLGVWGGILLLTPKGRRVFSPDYAAVRAATPHLRWRPKTASLIGAAVVGSLVLFGCAGLLLLGV